MIVGLFSFFLLDCSHVSLAWVDLLAPECPGWKNALEYL